MTDDGRFISSIYKKYLISSMLAILGSVVGQIGNNIIVGNFIDAQSLSVTGITLPIYYIYATIGNLLGIGGATLCGMLTGKDKFRESKEAFTMVYITMAITSVIITIVCLLNIEPLITLLGVNKQTDPVLFGQVYDYTEVMLYGGIFTMGIYPAFQFLRFDGKQTASVMIFVVMAVVNIALDFLFLMVFDMGIFGVSLATTIGTGAAAILGALILFFDSTNFKLVTVKLKDAAVHVKNLFLIGSPGAVENVSILLRSAFLNIIIMNIFTSMELSALSVTNSLNSFALIIISGVSGTIIPFVGVFSAEKDTKSIKQVLRVAFITGIILSTVFMLICIVFAEQIAGIFGIVEPAALACATSAVRIFSFSFILGVVNNIFISLHLSNNKTALANILTLFRSFVFVVSCALVLSQKMGIDGVWHSFWITEVLVILVMLIFNLIYCRRNKYLSKLFLIDQEAEFDGRYKSFSVKNSPEAVVEASTAISEFCEKNDLTPKKTMLISLALEEMLTMIDEHSLKDREDGSVSVRILIYRDIIVIRIRNNGVEFNPLKYYEKKKSEAVIDEFGLTDFDDSLGIKMIIDTTKGVDYQRTFGINNLTITL